MRTTSFCFLLLALAACSRDAPPPAPVHRPVTDFTPGRVNIGGDSVSLPQRIGNWTRPDTARRITAGTIFDYMDGAGELYLAYRFDHLDVIEYKADEASLGTILVEIYSMKEAEDAFGLLSNDWGGEAVPFDAGAPGGDRVRGVPSRRALYGAGLLRMWIGHRYVRVLASRETQDTREVVMALGQAIMTEGSPGQGGNASYPSLLRGLESEVDAQVTLRPERTCFFRSHLVLNSQYFLASEDILGLGPDVEAVTTEYQVERGASRPLRTILVRYPREDRARQALGTFTRAYLPEAVARGKAAPAGTAKIEKGWVGWALKGQDLVVTLDAPTAAAARDQAAAVLAAVGGRNAVS